MDRKGKLHRPEKATLLLEAAEYYLLNKDSAEFTFRNVAEKAGVNLALINYYFQNKDFFLWSIYLYVIEKSATQLNGILNLSLSQDAKTRLKTTLQHLCKERFKHFFIRQLYQKHHSSQQTIVYNELDYEDVFLEALTQIVLLSIKNNDFAKTQNPKLIHSFLLGTSQQLLKEYFFSNNISARNYEWHYKEFLKKNFSVLENLLHLILGAND